MTVSADTRITYDPVKLEQQKKHLDLLAVFHYVVAGIAGLMSLLALIYVGLGGVMAFNPRAFADGGGSPPAMFGCLILGMGLVFLGLGWAYAAFTVYAGRCLARRRNYTLCLVSAAISCTFSPFGTVLGIFTLILLMQAGVREVLFAAPETAAPPA